MSIESKKDGLRMIEFFSGIGGMRIAVENALQQKQPSAFQCVSKCQAYDISLHANRCYKANFQKEATVCTKLVEQLKLKDLDGKADLWTMSPPCQPFTKTRGAKGLDTDDKRCEGLKAIIRLLSAMEKKPRYILLENVKGFSNSRMAGEWRECLKTNLYTWKEFLLSPIQIGIPNHRQRYYIICEHSKTRWENSDRTIQHSLLNNSGNSVRFVSDYLDASITEKECPAEYLVPNEKLEQEWARQVGVVTGADTATHCFTAGYGRIFHKATGSLLLMRQDDDGEEAIAQKPLDRTDMLQYGGRLRRFTPKELLNLFGFPLDYHFPSEIKLEHQYKLIGNSINVTVVTALVNELLFGEEEESNVGDEKGHMVEL